MATNPKVAATYRKGMLDGAVSIKTDANSGKLKIYSGSQPTDGDTAVGAQTLLATLTMNATAFTGPSGTASTIQTLTANAITSDTNAAATGTAAWFRLQKSDGTTNIMDGTVGTSSSDLTINSTSITIATTVAASSMTISLAV